MLTQTSTDVPATINQSAILFEIEETVHFIAKHYFQSKGMVGDHVNRELFNPAYYQKLFEQLPLLFSVFDPAFTYDTYVASFLYEGVRTGIIDYPEMVLSKQRCFEWLVLDDFVAQIAFRIRQPLFSHAVSVCKHEIKQRNDRLIRYAKSLHLRYARLLVIRIDFGYKKESMIEIDIKTFYQHQDKLAKRIETNDLFTHLAGHARSLEQAKERGLHCHAVFYFKGDKHQSHYLAKQIGDMWLEITENQGSFYSPNLDKESKERFKQLGTLGIGMIHRDRPDEVDNAVNAISYLTRPDKDQYLRIRPRGRRIFFAGVIKK